MEHPYRDDFRSSVERRFGVLETRCADAEQACAKLATKVAKQNKSWPISESIAAKIRSFGMETMFLLLLWAGTVGIASYAGYSIYMSTTTDSVPDLCTYDLNPEGKWTVIGRVDWGQNQLYGPFFELEDAKSLGKTNGCPN